MMGSMDTVAEVLQELLTRSIDEHYPDDSSFLPADISQSTNDKFGHYQCNSAMRIGKVMKCNPREVAQKIVDGAALKPLVEKIEIAGPGFINLTLSRAFLNQQINAVASNDRLGVAKPKKRKKVVVDFSSPNIAKELHVGHLRSTIIGDCIARLMEFLGHDVLRLNHVGDWGTQFGMLIGYLKEHEEDVLLGKKQATLSDLMKWYREAKKIFDADPDFKKRSQENVVALQGGDPVARDAWKRICAISRTAFEEIYNLLGIKIEERGESFYNDYLPDVIETVDKKGLSEMSEGAKCIFLDGFDVPMSIQKSDGGYNYSSTDLATIRHRIFEEKADRIIYVVDAGQSLHFKMLFDAAEKIGWLDPSKTEVNHVAFGVVLGPDGKKFKTRSGETERLIDLIMKAVNQAQSLMQERLTGAKSDEIEEAAKVLGVDAIKYSDLASHRLKDYLFSYERMLRFEGNTAAFLLYAFVRIQGIKRKINKPIDARAEISIEHDSEEQLALHLIRFSEVLKMIDRDLLPHRLCEYLYTLAEKFNLFYRDCPVEGHEMEKSRLRLCDLTERILEKGLDLLGLKTLKRM